MHLSRRQFLHGPLGAVLWATLPGRARAQEAHDPILAVIDRNFPALRADRQELHRFCEDLLTYMPEVVQDAGYSKYQSLSWLRDTPVIGWFVPTSTISTIDSFEGLIMRHFLLSTNFFDVVDDPEAQLSYVAFADPYVSGCANPLARFD